MFQTLALSWLNPSCQGRTDAATCQQLEDENAQGPPIHGLEAGWQGAELPFRCRFNDDMSTWCWYLPSGND